MIDWAPFYYIVYGLAPLDALRVWRRSLVDRGEVNRGEEPLQMR
jgi:hypothetical protein